MVQVIFFIAECGIKCFLCTMHVLCTHSTFGHNPHPLGYLRAKVRLCRFGKKLSRAKVEIKYHQNLITSRVHCNTQVMWLAVTEVWSVSEVQASGCCVVLRVQHVCKFCNFLVTWGLPVTIFHSSCIFCLYSMALYWPILQIYVGMYISFACRYVVPPGECYYNTLLCCDDFSSLSVVSHAFSALCVYSTFGHHPRPLGYLCAKFSSFRSLHCWASPRRKWHTQSLTYLLNHSPSLFDAPGSFEILVNKFDQFLIKSFSVVCRDTHT